MRRLGARIDGPLDLSGAQFESAGGEAIDLADTVIEGSMFLVEDLAGHRPVVRGRIHMGSARIAGRLLIRNAILEAPDSVPKDSGYARSGSSGACVSAPRLSVGAEVTLAEHCEVTGTIDMSMGDMSSMFIGENCVLRAPGRTALDLTNAEIRSLLRMDENATVQGTIKLAGAVIHGTLALHGQLSQPPGEPRYAAIEDVFDRGEVA